MSEVKNDFVHFPEREVQYPCIRMEGRKGTVLERGQFKSLGTNHPETSLHVLFSPD